MAEFELTNHGIDILINKAVIGKTVDVTLQILHIYKFYSDQAYQTLTNTEDVYGYDIVLTDGNKKIKCVLSPKLHQLVKVGELRCSGIIKVTGTDQRFDETNPKAVGVLIIRELSVLSSTYYLIKRLKEDEPYREYSFDRHPNEVIHSPLLTHREYYISTHGGDDVMLFHPEPDDPHHLNMFDILPSYVIDPKYSNDPHAQELAAEALEAKNFVNKEIEAHVFIQTVIGEGKNTVPSKQYIIGRIISISKVTHFGNVKKHNRYPLKFELVLEDTSGCVTVVLWNSLVRKYYSFCRIGDIVAINGWQVKPSRPTRFSPVQSQQFECNLNPKTAYMLFLLEKLVSSSIIRPLSSATFNIVPLNQLKQVTDKQLFDIVGAITYISRPMRQILSDGKLQEYRWVLFADHTCDRLCSVKIVVKQQHDPLNNIKLGDIVLCTNLEAITTNIIKNSNDPRSICCISTKQTSIVMHDILDRIQSDHLDILYEWRASVSDEILIKMEPMYRWIQDYDTWCNTFRKKELVPLRSISDRVYNMFLKECDTIIIQGYITAININKKSLKKRFSNKRKLDDEKHGNWQTPRLSNVQCGLLRIENLNKEYTVSVRLKSEPVYQAAWGADNTLYHELKVDKDPNINVFLRTVARLLPKGWISINQWKVLKQIKDVKRLEEAMLKLLESRRLIFGVELYRKSSASIDVTLTSVFDISNVDDK